MYIFLYKFIGYITIQLIKKQLKDRDQPNVEEMNVDEVIIDEIIGNHRHNVICLL